MQKSTIFSAFSGTFYYEKSSKSGIIKTVETTIFKEKKVARNSLETRLMEQSDMIMQLNKMILSLQQTIEGFNAREAAMLQEIQTLKEQNDYLTKKLFGKSSEKNSWDMEGQLNLFNEVEQEQDTSLLEQEQEETKTVTFTVKKGRSADKDRYAGLPVEKKYLDVPEEERFCPDC